MDSERFKRLENQLAKFRDWKRKGDEQRKMTQSVQRPNDSPPNRRVNAILRSSPHSLSAKHSPSLNRLLQPKIDSKFTPKRHVMDKL